MEMLQMPQYTCHKTVGALKIKEVCQSPADASCEVGGEGTWELVPENDAYTIVVTHKWYCKHSPYAGGYYVVYKDGYASFSPAASFEEDYKPLMP